MLSRLYPSRFRQTRLRTSSPARAGRLNYPFNYADGTGNLLAIGAAAAAGHRHAGPHARRAGRSRRPVCRCSSLGIVMTASRGALADRCGWVVVYFVLAPDRLAEARHRDRRRGGIRDPGRRRLRRGQRCDGPLDPVAIAERHQLAAARARWSASALRWSRPGSRWRRDTRSRPHALRISRRRAAQTRRRRAGRGRSCRGRRRLCPGRLAARMAVVQAGHTRCAVSGNVYERLGTLRAVTATSTGRGGARVRVKAADRHRPGNVRVLLGAARLDLRVHPQRPFAVSRDARRDRASSASC